MVKLVETEAARVVEIREKPLRAVNVAVLTLREWW